MAKSKELILKIDTAIKQEMQLIGFQFCNDENLYFHCDSEEITSCVDIQHRAQGESILIDVSVGVHHHMLEKILAVLKERKLYRHSPMSLGTTVGYLLPNREHVSYVVSNISDIETRSRRIVYDVSRYGRPFMTSCGSLRAIADRLADARAKIPQASVAFRLPIALYLLGEGSLAIEKNIHYLNHLAADSSVWASEYRAFTNAFQKFVAGSS